MKNKKSTVPVIVVGNISVGGTGKTPVVIALVEHLRLIGLQPGVISRGYKGDKSKHPLFLTADTPPADAGDEPVMIFRRLGCPICVDSDRNLAIQTLLSKSDCNVIVSDDGLQHYAMDRDFEIAVVDGHKLHGNGFCLPAGPLREPMSRLKRVDYVLENCQTDRDDDHTFTLNPTEFMSISQSVTKALHDFNGKQVHAVAGTGHPERFFRTLESLGIGVIPHPFPDHHEYSAEDFRSLGDKPVIMTEKDAVKCRNFGLSNAWSLAVTTDLPEPLLNQITKLLKKSETVYE